jgi:hypothetical protein
MEAVMKKLFILALVFISTLLLYGAAYSNNNHTTFLGPTAAVGFTSALNDYTAYSVAGEAGLKNFRIGGTLGWKLAENQGFKVSGEYLWQKITYSFFSGNPDEWVQQGALGAAYQYDFLDYSYRPEFDVSAYVSHAPSKTLGTVTGTLLNAQGVQVPFTEARRIAGSNGAGIAPGLAFVPWQGGRVFADLNYDSVRYNKTFSPNQDAIGFGGTIGLNQALTENVGLGLSAAVRRPFNNYAATLSWNNVPYFGEWTLGLFGDYTAGKNTLPNTYNAGISFDYFLDPRCGIAVPMNLKGERNLKGEATIQPINDNLLAFTADPAVYMPQVLAIGDEKVEIGSSVPACNSAVHYIGPADPGLLLPVQNGPFNFNFAPLFNGSPIVFSLAVTVLASEGVPVGLPSDFSIDPNSGVLTYHGNADGAIYRLTVIGTNGCGSASVTFEYDNETD